MDMNEVVKRTAKRLNTSIPQVERFLDAYSNSFLDVEREFRALEEKRMARETTVSAELATPPESDVTPDTMTETPAKKSAKVRRTAAKQSTDTAEDTK